jgi:hypothetical protein
MAAVLRVFLEPKTVLFYEISEMISICGFPFKLKLKVFTHIHQPAAFIRRASET